MSGLPGPTHDEWQKLVGSSFEVDGTAPGSDRLVLSECAPARYVGGITSFSLRFSAPSDTALAQGTYDFRSDGIQPLAIFIVPLGQGDTNDTTEYEAVFNQQEDPSK